MPNDRTVSLHVPRVALWLFGLLLITPWVAFVIWTIYWAPKPAAEAPSPVAPSATRPAHPPAGLSTVASDLTTTNSGPWGTLEYFTILLEPPEEFIQADYSSTTVKPWLFKGYTEAQLNALLESAKLDASQRAFAWNPAHREVVADGIKLRVSPAFIENLSPESRATLYTALGEFIENYPQHNPFRIRAVAADRWLENADVPESAIALSKRLFYRRGNSICFSDEAIVLPTIPTTALRAKYVKALSRKAALVVQLRVAPGEDIGPLVAYWARGGRSKDLRPLLQSLARRPNGGAIDIVHLLPRFARLFVYTYPLPSQQQNDVNRDCHWTALNFQSDPPDERFSDIEYVRKVLYDEYYPVPGSPTLGDLLMFVREDGVVVHSCVYIADDIVFSKNGPAYTVPWLLTPLADVQAYYATPGTEIRRFRRKAE